MKPSAEAARVATGDPGERSTTAFRPRGPGLTFAALTLALMVLVALIALTAKQPPPPTIAEFAPQATERITDAPPDQNGAGTGRGTSLGDGMASQTPSPATEAAVSVPRVRRCVGDPPRQVEDPQSPPCVPYWSGDNGGATTRGVTRDEIIVVPNNANNGTNQGNRVNAGLEKFFNSRFEFYGRRLRLDAPKDANANSGTCEQRKAGAVAIVQQNGAFAFTNKSGGGAACFYDEASRLGLIAVEVGGVMAEKDLSAGRPYLWQYGSGTNEVFAQWGRFICRRLAGKTADHATDVSLRQQRRKFGLLVQSQETPYRVDTAPLKRELASCGEQLAFEGVSYASDDDNETRATNNVIQMMDAGVTTVLVMSGVPATATVPSTASSQRYYPEWLFSDGLNLDFSRNWTMHAYWPDSSQRASLAGLMVAPEQVPYPDVAMNWALAEADSGFQVNQNSTWLHANLKTYWALLLVASGIQMAGPNLTPTTFEQGLQRTLFPNAATPPVQEGWAGFSDGRHAMIHDATAVWWSDAAPSPYPDEGVGAWCYAEGGRRYKIDEWTKGPDELFDGACHTSPADLDR